MSPSRGFWIVKSEPGAYSWQTFEKEGRAVWDGVRNFQARNNLRAMKKGDPVFFYHSNVGQEVVGVARVRRESFPDPTANDPRWLSVELEPVRALKNPVSLRRIKADSRLSEMKLVKQSRLSVIPVTEREFNIILQLSRNNLSSGAES